MLQTEYKFGEVKRLSEQISVSDEKVQFKQVFASENGGVTLLALKAGQELSTHTAPAELMVNVFDGEIVFTMLGNPHHIKAGEFMLVGADVPHSVKAVADSKVLLIKIKP